MDVTEIVSKYVSGGSLKGIAAQAGVCYSVIRRILITEGVELRDCPQADTIHAMLANGVSVQEISVALGINRKTVESYMPYTKCSYSIGDKSANALRIRACRAHKKER